MSRTLNKVMLIGNVGKKPVLKHTPSGIPVISLRLATSETWKDRNGAIQEHTDWHTVIAWRGLAEVINKLVYKGSRIYVEGRIQTRSFEDKSLNKRLAIEILASNMLLLDKKGRDSDGNDNSLDLSDDSSDDSFSDNDFDYSGNIPDDDFEGGFSDKSIYKNSSKDIPF